MIAARAPAPASGSTEQLVHQACRGEVSEERLRRLFEFIFRIEAVEVEIADLNAQKSSIYKERRAANRPEPAPRPEPILRPTYPRINDAHDGSQQTFVYFAVSYDQQALKIGISTNVKRRIANLNTAHPQHIRLWFSLEGYPADEQFFHRAFADCRLKGEWFALSDDLISRIISLLSERRGFDVPQLPELH